MASMNYSPKKLAAACAVGILIGISPYFGLHTYLAIGCSTIFRLPVFPILVLSSVTNPLTVPFIYAFTTKLGMKLLGIHLEYDIDWSHISFSELLNAGKVLVIPFFVGTHIAGALLSVFTYFIVYYIVIRYRSWKKTIGK
jgi:uncharacterized protein (DUF2062 family)